MCHLLVITDKWQLALVASVVEGVLVPFCQGARGHGMEREKGAGSTLMGKAKMMAGMTSKSGAGVAMGLDHRVTSMSCWGSGVGYGYIPQHPL
jgi:hypothetical protein